MITILKKNLSSNYKLFYLENYNIIESDENGTFVNTLYDGDKNVYQFFLEKETQNILDGGFKCFCSIRCF